MTIDEYVRMDSTFNRSKFLGDVNRMIQTIYMAISSDQLDSVQSLMSEKAFKKLQDRVSKKQIEGMSLKYDHVFIDSDIVEIYNEKHPVIRVISTCSFSKYYVSDGKIVKGSDTDMIKILHSFSFSKNNNDLSFYRCVGCGASYDVRVEDQCPNCGNSLIEERYDYTIVEME